MEKINAFGILVGDNIKKLLIQAVSVPWNLASTGSVRGHKNSFNEADWPV
jgi:hypothetical protein